MQMTMIFSDGACTARGLPMLEHKDFFWSHAAVRHDLKNAPQERGLLHGLWRAASSHMKSGSSNLKKNPKPPKHGVSERTTLPETRNASHCCSASSGLQNPSSLCLILLDFGVGVKAREAAWCAPTRCAMQRTRT